ncbi:hypothetical protein L484_023035 [Morus notabilis]|uniref:Uncharacterized protein n=1 Tax=Morus notabilis TaxID=981085 RepID=W9S9G8_9ROSA|nr:hypothetical protein L484_023035 [Morus notabilis]
MGNVSTSPEVDNVIKVEEADNDAYQGDLSNESSLLLLVDCCPERRQPPPGNMSQFLLFLLRIAWENNPKGSFLLVLYPITGPLFQTRPPQKGMKQLLCFTISENLISQGPKVLSD